MAKRKTGDDEGETAEASESTIDLSTLEYPRHVHKAGGEYQVVADAEACAAAREEGWALQPPKVTP